MDETALFRLSYGLYAACVAFGGKQTGCIVNTAAQVTASPARLSVTMLKSNLTSELARKKGSLTLAVLTGDVPLDFISDFGTRSGRDCDKFASVAHAVDGAGNPYPTVYTCARFSMQVDTVLDLDTHYQFIGLLTEAARTGDAPPLTYAGYHERKAAARAAAAAETAGDAPKRWVCTVCHWVYDGETPFEELPDDWVCPVCHQPKSVFQPLD